MKNRFLKGIQFRFLIIFVSSIFCALFTIMLFQLLLKGFIGVSSSDLAKMEKEYAFLYFVFFLVLTTNIFFMFSRFVIKRIEKIVNYVSEVKNGNFDAYIDVKANDEIGELSKGIIDMVNTIKEYMEKQKRSEETKNEMISNISHDLRTPLTSLSGYIELLKSNINDANVSYDYMDIIDLKCNVLKSQINDLLDYCNLSNNEIKLDKKRINVKGLVEQVMIDFIPSMEKDGIEFSLDLHQEQLYIDADINLFVRLMQNIIGNAISYGKAGKRVKVEAFSNNREVVIRIINYGEAIPKEDILYIFERFYRSEKSRNANTGGKGMGLAVAKSIVDLHNGKIEVYSDDNETVFEIRIPENLN